MSLDTLYPQKSIYPIPRGQLDYSQPFISVGEDRYSDFRVSDYADALAALQAACDYVNSPVGTGGIVFVKRGNYALTAGQSLNIKGKTSFRGEGDATKFTLASTAQIIINTMNDVDLSDFYIDATAQVFNDYGIRVKNSSNFTAARIRGVFGGFGIFLDTDLVDAVSRFTIRDCRLKGLGFNDIIGGGTQASTGPILREVIVDGNFVEQDVSGTGNYTNAIDIVSANRFKFINNVTYGNILFGTEQFPHLFSEISHNTVNPAIGDTDGVITVDVKTTATTAAEGILIQSNIVTRGQIKFLNDSGQNLLRFGIIGNLVRGNIGRAISIKAASVGVIANNVLSDASDGAIYLEDSNNLVIIGNHITDGTNGIRDFTGSGAANIYVGNSFLNVTNRFVNIPSAATIDGNASDNLPKANTYQLKDTDGTFNSFGTITNTAPDADIQIVSDYVKQVGATVVTFNEGFNSELTKFRRYSKWSGVNTQYDELDVVTGNYIAKEGHINIEKVGKTLGIKTGVNGKTNSAVVLVAGTLVVANTSVTANSFIILARTAAGGATGDLSYVLNPGVGFTINSTSALDTSTVDWLILEKI